MGGRGWGGRLLWGVGRLAVVEGGERGKEGEGRGRRRSEYSRSGGRGWGSGIPRPWRGGGGGPWWVGGRVGGES
jgi:hypothetical protein